MGWKMLLLGVGGTALGCGLLFTIGWLVAGFRFGISAIVALLHDVLVLIGSFAILGYFLNWQIDSMFIVATLTVVGFSVHDTIVIFDRLRENLRHRMRGEEFDSLANRSILQSFARSINTSFTVILTLLAMMIWGEPSTRLLITALLIGIVSGTYSSIFNATPILVDWENALARLRGIGRGVSLMPAMPPGASSGGGSARPIRTAKTTGVTRPVVETPSDDSEAPASTGERPSVRNKPKKRSQRRF
jgi:SecD/SecF fusion protein